MSTTAHEPELNALDQAKHDYERHAGIARREIDAAEDNQATSHVAWVQAAATLALAAATRMQAEAALIALERAEQLTQQVQAQLDGRTLAQAWMAEADAAGEPFDEWDNRRHDLGLARTVVSAEGRPEDDGLPVFGKHVTALTMREERLVREAFVAGRDGFAKVMADRAEATPADAGEGL